MDVSATDHEGNCGGSRAPQSMAVFVAIRRLMGFLGLFRVPPVVPE